MFAAITVVLAWFTAHVYDFRILHRDAHNYNIITLPVITIFLFLPVTYEIFGPRFPDVLNYPTSGKFRIIFHKTEITVLYSHILTLVSESRRWNAIL